MNSLDSFINQFITPNSVSAGVGTVFLTIFSGKIAPKMPKRFYDLLDNNLVRMFVVAFLINQQIRKPSLSILISVTMVLGFEVLVKIFAPDTPSLAELVRSTAEEDKNSDQAKNTGGCNCYCGSTIYTEGLDKRRSKPSPPSARPRFFHS